MSKEHLPASTQSYTETVSAGGRDYVLSALTLKEARLVDWEGPEFMNTVIFGSLMAGGHVPEGLTVANLQDLPYFQVYELLWKAARRVNGLAPAGEAKAAPEITEAA